MPPVETTHAVIDLFAGWGAGQPVAKAADNVTKGMTAEGVGGQQYQIDQQDQSSNAYAESAVEPECVPDVASKNDKEGQCQVEKISMHVLHN